MRVPEYQLRSISRGTGSHGTYSCSASRITLMSKSWGLTAWKFGLDEDDSVGGEKRSCRFPFLEPDLEANISLVRRLELLVGSVLSTVFGGMGFPASSAAG